MKFDEISQQIQSATWNDSNLLLCLREIFYFNGVLVYIALNVTQYVGSSNEEWY